MNLSAYEDYSEKLKAIGHPVRLRIAIALVEKEYAVSALCEELNIPQATLSQHLSILRNKNIVEGRRKGTSITYHLYSEAIRYLLEMIQESFTEFSKRRKVIPQKNIIRA